MITGRCNEFRQHKVNEEKIAASSVRRVCIQKSSLQVFQEGNKDSGLGVASCYEGHKVRVCVSATICQSAGENVMDKICNCQLLRLVNAFEHIYETVSLLFREGTRAPNVSPEGRNERSHPQNCV